MMTVSEDDDVVDDDDDDNDGHDDDGLDRRQNDDDDEHYDNVVDSTRGADPALGRTTNDGMDVSNENDDDERYSRQMYTLGARAHRLVRSTTAVLDGPLGGSSSRGGAGTCETPSGLLYEIAKNLALSGVGRIVLVGGEGEDDDDDDDENPVVDVGYFDGSLDDLGAAYRRAALAELVGGDVAIGGGVAGAGFRDDGASLLAEYVRRLNPGVRVDVISRSALMNSLRGSRSYDEGSKCVIAMEDHEGGDDSNYDDERGEDDDVMICDSLVVVCVDRSTSMQLEMNDACRGRGGGGGEANGAPPRRVVPFISVETAGLHAKVFCDFGPNFVVVDEDGESPRSTLLQRVEEVTNDDDGNAGDVGGEARLYSVKCLQGEHHDVSRGDVIEFHGNGGEDHGTRVAFPKCRVMSVKSPTCFIVTQWDGATATNQASENKLSTDSNSSKMTLLLEGKARSFARIKLSKQLSFLSLREILKPNDDERSVMTFASNRWDDETLFAASDLDKSFDLVRRRVVMSSMLALDEFVQKYGRLPLRSLVKNNDNGSKHKRTDVELFQSLVQKIIKNDGDSLTSMERKDSLVAQFAQTCRAKFTPVQALAGALGAQEVLKVATGLYNPIRQILLYDCDEVLQGSSEGVRETGADGSDSSPGLSYILGEATSKKLARSRLFLVGAGAIGCELLKNLAALGAGIGVGSTRHGSIILTDMDTIEKSNLSRQLLFRDHDVGEFKSVAARAAVMRFSPNACVEVHTSRVGGVDEGPFDDEFWSSGCDVVLNALDNVEARLFVDSQCVTHGLGLIDAGTLGPKGNVQVVIPQQSESYGSSADPPEPDIPVCTLKNFPYEISHTIQWARDLFDGYFNRRPRQANDYVSEISQIEDLHAFGQSMIVKMGDDAAIAMAEELGEDLGPLPFVVGADVEDTDYVLAVNKHSLDWAIHQAHMLFYVTMTELIQKHPLDSVDDDGVPFWSGARRAPKPMRFIPLDSEEDEVSAQQVIINERIAQFVSAAARLRMESFLDVHNNKSVTLITLEDALFALQEKARLLEKKKKKSNAFMHNLSGGGKDSDTLSLILERLNEAKIGATFLPHLNLVDFEKDDESNGHVSFITAASNLRAMAYGIPPADAMETRRVAGRIVPAMITTTALVSALSCLELVKLLKGLPLAAHRNGFVNLALPFFAFTAPMPAEEVSGVDGRKHTIWSRLTCSGPITTTLEHFLKKILLTADCTDSIEVSSVSYGPYMIFANFLHSQDQELLDTPLLDAVKDSVISEDYDEMTSFDEVVGENQERTVRLSAEQKTMLTRIDHKRFVDFSVLVEDIETGEEFELPTVRFIKDKPQQDSRTSHDDD
jgi:ubiquitin-activating enzyme E1